jgi:hypothetical protein
MFSWKDPIPFQGFTICPAGVALHPTINDGILEMTVIGIQKDEMHGVSK